MNEIKRISAGVVFESDVLQFIDQIATEQQRHRSFIINQIIRIYARSEDKEPSHSNSAKIKPMNNKLFQPNKIA